MIKFLPYRQGSRSVRRLREVIPNSRILRTRDSQFHGRVDDFVVNWGFQKELPFTYDQILGLPACTILNMPEDVERVSNKFWFFNLCREEGVEEDLPPFWTDPDTIPNDAFPVVCRTLLRAHSGRGIVIANNRAQLVRAPLYVKYIKKRSEFRVHLGLRPGEDEPSIISLQRKVRRRDHDHPNWRIRNHDNGFIYQRNNLEVPECVVPVANRVFKVTGLDFGAVDVIYNQHQDKAYVLEINTAPGLEGTTVNEYAEYFSLFE